MSGITGDVATGALVSALPGLTAKEAQAISDRLAAAGYRIESVTSTTPGASRYGFATLDVGERITGHVTDEAAIRAAWQYHRVKLPGVRFAGNREGEMFYFTRTA